MAGESLIIGDGNWGVKSSSLLGYAVNSGRFVPRELTFTRATTGTRTNGALLVEEVPYNLFDYSEQFENTYWEKGSGLYVNSNFSAAPTGLITSDKLTFTGVGAFFVNRTFINLLLASTTYTYSIYVKNIDSAGYLGLGIGGGLNESVWFNMATMQISSATSGVTGTIQQINDGWYRLTVTGITGSVLNNNYTILIHSDTPQTAFFPNVVNSNKSILAWGAQLVFGSSAKTYLPTTTRLNIPRIDYSTGTAALLIEPQRTNVILRSEEFDNASWSKSGATIIANDTTAPSGLTTADRITQSAATVNISQVVSLSAGAVTFSTYVKRGNFDSSTTFLFGLFSTVTADIGYISFNFVTGTTAVYSGTFISHSATNVGNGWYRIQGTINVPSTGLGYFYNGGAGLTIAGVGSYYYSWGAQVEVGNCATSYIPTTSASVTRNADAIGRSGFQAAGLLTATQNTFFFNLSSVGTTGSNYNFLTFTATSGLPIAVWRFAGNQNFNIQISGVFIDTGVTSGKFAVVQNGSQTKLFINGVLNTTGGATGPIDALANNINLYALAAPTFIKTLSMYPTALSDAECIALTT